MKAGPDSVLGQLGESVVTLAWPTGLAHSAAPLAAPPVSSHQGPTVPPLHRVGAPGG